jgi:outer membrane protein OmpA-like peptidoglycan-associated protein
MLPLRPFIFLIIIAVFTCACATKQSEQPLVPEEPLNPVEELNLIENEIAIARQNQNDVLSPVNFAKAESAYLKAKSIAEKEGSASRILEYIDDSRQYLKNTEENARVARTVLAQVIESRRMARIAGAPKLGKNYENIEHRFLELTRAIEKNNIRYAQKNAPAVNKDFRKIEMRAIKTETIGEVKAILKKAEKDEITQYAPESFAYAKQLLNETDAFISENPYAKAEMYQMAQNNLFMARRALSIADQCKAIQTMKPEEIALYVEDILFLIATQLSAPDMRDQKFYIQEDNIEESIKSLLDDNMFMKEQLTLKRNALESLQVECDKKTVELNQQIAFLEGKSKEERAEIERLQAEQRAMEQRLETDRQLSRIFAEVRSSFRPEEAEVYKKGNQLVLRLKGIQFPVGQAIIMPENYFLLSKAQRAIRHLTNPSVVIEGHTDSTGTPELNKHLSQQRADAVRDYLIANQTLPANKIIAVGYGSERPLASNATPEGRAINRRIDIIIAPGTQTSVN